MEASRFRAVVVVEALDWTEALEAVETSLDLTEAVEGAGDFGRDEAGSLDCVGAETGAAEGLAEGGTIGAIDLTTRLLFEDGVGDAALTGFDGARNGVLPLSVLSFVGEGSFDGDLGTGSADADAGVLVDAVVLVVRTDLTDAADEAFWGVA